MNYQIILSHVQLYAEGLLSLNVRPFFNKYFYCVSDRFVLFGFNVIIHLAESMKLINRCGIGI